VKFHPDYFDRIWLQVSRICPGKTLIYLSLHQIANCRREKKITVVHLIAFLEKYFQDDGCAWLLIIIAQFMVTGTTGITAGIRKSRCQVKHVSL